MADSSGSGDSAAAASLDVMNVDLDLDLSTDPRDLDGLDEDQMRTLEALHAAAESCVACKETNGEDYDSEEEKKKDERQMSKVRRERLMHVLQSDLAACDMLLSLLVSAASSYRFDSVLSPFPSDYVTKKDKGEPPEKDIDGLRAVLDVLPPLDVVRTRLENDDESFPDELLRILHWVLADNRINMRLKSVDKSDFKSVIGLPNEGATSSASKTPEPTHIFSVEHPKRDAMWRRAARKAAAAAAAGGETKAPPPKSLYGFHGSRPENFYSILNHGLQQHLNKTSLFGTGIYLSSELSMSLSYSKSGQTWIRSRIGDQVSCVLLSEVVDHRDVKLHTDDPKRNRLDDSESGRVPEKYLIVRNNDLIRNAYILVYASRTGREEPRAGSVSTQGSGVRSRHIAGAESDRTPSAPMSEPVRQAAPPHWLWEHKFTLLLLSYGLLLVAVGMARSAMFHKLLRRYGFLDDDLL